MNLKCGETEERLLVKYSKGTCSFIALLGVALMCVGTGCGKRQAVFDLTDVLRSRPVPVRHIYDFAGKIKQGLENPESQLDHFEKKYGVETVVVTIPSLGGREIKAVAAEMFSTWKIGNRFGRKGLLLLVSFKERELKLEVGYGAEAVFTDLFCGYIERMAVQPFFQAGYFGDGLMAIWEHFIAKAENTLNEEAMTAYLKDAASYASGGAGGKDGFPAGNSQVSRTLTEDMRKIFIPQPTPEALVKTSIEACRLCVNVGMTPLATEATAVMTQMIGVEPSRLQCDNGLRAWSGPYEILQDGDHAVAMFYTTDKAQPIMMEKGAGGWLLDIYHMRRHALFDHANRFFIKGEKFPYDFAFKNGKYAAIPKDHYAYAYGLLSPAGAEGYKKHWERLRSEAEKNPKDTAALLNLAKLYIDLTLQNQAADILEQVIRLDPNNAEAYKCMAYLQFDLFAAPQKTLDFIDRYRALQPGDRKILLWKARSYERLGKYDKAAETIKDYCGDDRKSVWCSNYLGYYNFLAGRHDKAKEYFEKTLKLKPENVYAKDYLEKIKAGDLPPADSVGIR